jgi:uncharacterized Zn finger protein
MTKQQDPLANLSWDSLNDWAGDRIVARGRKYQQQKRVSSLAKTNEGSLIAWVEGSTRYATQVDIDDEEYLHSICSCPYGINCKHGVAVLLEYLARLEDEQSIPNANQEDERIKFLSGEGWSDASDDRQSPLQEAEKEGIERTLKKRTKSQLIELIIGFAELHRDIGADLFDSEQLEHGDASSLVAGLRKEIGETAEQPGWQDYWQGEGYTPDYSGIRSRLQALLDAGHADDVLALGEALLDAGTRQVEESDDDGETAMEIAACLPVVVSALEQSSLPAADKLMWAIDAVLQDDYELCAPLADYLLGNHEKSVWRRVAETLLKRLSGIDSSNGTGSYNRDHVRDQRSDWTIYALEHAGRSDEIIPLCEAEAQKTGSFTRLVDRLIAAERYDDAQLWITEGIHTVGQRYPGIAGELRDQFMQTCADQENWPAVTALQIEEFVRSPSRQNYLLCQQAAARIKGWTRLRDHLLVYLETGELPWRHSAWALPESGLQPPEPSSQDLFPELDTLIDIAIHEKKPDVVLQWYDRRSPQHYARYGTSDDTVATAVKNFAPARAIAIWENIAQEFIAQVKPSAYLEAVRYMKKARKLVIAQSGQEKWNEYLQDIRVEHRRKRRLMELLDGLDGKPILKNKMH